MHARRRLASLAAGGWLLLLASSPAAQGLTTIVTPPSVTWTGDLALADHGAAYIGTTGSSSEIHVYLFALHQLLQVTSTGTDKHALVATSNSLLWVEGRGITSTLWEYVPTRNFRRPLAKPPGTVDPQWLIADENLAVAHDGVAGRLWLLNLDTLGWQAVSTVFRRGTDAVDLCDGDLVWTEPVGSATILHHQRAGGAPRIIHTTTARIGWVRVASPFVVWHQDSGPNASLEVYSHNLNARQTTQITSNSYRDFGPVLVGSRVAWIAPLNGTGPDVIYDLDLKQGGTPRTNAIQAKVLQAAWDGVFYHAGPNGRTIAHYNFLESRNTVIETGLDITRPDGDGNGRLVMYRKKANQIKLYMPALDVRPSEPLASSADRVGLYLAAGPVWGSKNYVVLASVSGFRPGIQVGLVTIPLNPDPILFLSLVLANVSPFENTASSLSPAGTGLATFGAQPPLRQVLIGLDVYWAYTLLPVEFASNPVRMRIRP